jgi:hypothetical protein
MAQLLRSVRNFFTRRAAPKHTPTPRYWSDNPPPPTAEAIAEYNRYLDFYSKEEMKKYKPGNNILTYIDSAKERIPYIVKYAAGKLEKPTRRGNYSTGPNLGIPNYAAAAAAPRVVPKNNFYSTFYGTPVGGKRRKSRKLRRRS